MVSRQFHWSEAYRRLEKAGLSEPTRDDEVNEIDIREMTDDVVVTRIIPCSVVKSAHGTGKHELDGAQKLAVSVLNMFDADIVPATTNGDEDGEGVTTY